MLNNKQIPKGYKPYKTVEGKFAAYIGPYYIKNNFPNTKFRVFISNKLSNLNEVAHGGFLMAYADSVGGFYAYNKVKKPIVTVNLNCNFIKPVPVYSWLDASGNIKMSGKSLIFVEIHRSNHHS